MDQAIKIRDERFHDYTKLLLVFGIPALLFGAAILSTNAFGWLSAPNEHGYSPLYAWVMASLWIPAGATACVWGEFVLRVQSGFNYEDFLNFDPSRWKPIQRLIVTVGIAFIFAFLLAFNAVQLGIGGLLLNDFAGRKPPVSLAVGGITGLGFAAVRDLIFRLKPEARA